MLAFIDFLFLFGAVVRGVGWLLRGLFFLAKWIVIGVMRLVVLVPRLLSWIVGVLVILNVTHLPSWLNWTIFGVITLTFGATAILDRSVWRQRPAPRWARVMKAIRRFLAPAAPWADFIRNRAVGSSRQEPGDPIFSGWATSAPDENCEHVGCTCEATDLVALPSGDIKRSCAAHAAV